MTAIRSSRLVGPLSIVLAGMMLALVVPTSVLSRAEAQTQNRLLLLFPVIDRSEAGYEDVAARATGYLQMAMNEVEGMRAAEFSRTSPMVLRAVKEGQIRSVDLDAEVTDPVTALQMGHALGADEVCLATVMSVTVSEDPLQVEVLLNGQCYGVEENVDAEAMQVVEQPKASNTFGVSGESRVREGYTGSVEPLVREALRDAAYKAAQVLSGTPAEEMMEEEQVRDRKGWRWALVALAVIGLVVAANDDDGDGNGQPAQEAALPPRDLQLRIETAAIRLLWTAPNSTLPLLRYDIQRSLDSGATWNPVPDSVGSVEASDTMFADFDVTEGTNYRYRIRAQYAPVAPSDWVEFRTVEFPG